MIRFPVLLAALSAVFAAFASTTEISVNLVLDDVDYVAGERARAVIDVANSSPNKISVGYSNSMDKLFVEVFKADGKSELAQLNDAPFTAAFMVMPNEGQKLEVFLGDHFSLREPRRYLARAVLVHDGLRYEGQFRAFDIVPGLKVAGALQMFSNVEGLRREFDLLAWNRKGTEHLFLTAHDEGVGSRAWVTTDLGSSLRITKPTVTVLPTGEVIVLHRFDRDHFLRSEFWSLPDVLEFQGNELMQDPEIAGTERIRDLYRESGGVKPKANPWWKFW